MGQMGSVEVSCEKCGWVNRACANKEQAPKKCPDCGARVVIAVRYRSDVNGSIRHQREHEAVQ